MPLDWFDFDSQVTASDIKRVATKLLSSKPVVAAYGDISCMPSYSTIASALKN
jgi:hypothetical protein